MKRLFIAFGLVLVATISGVAFSLHPSGASAQPDNRYVALGDSVAAGLGLAGSTADTTCGKSAQAYAYQVAAAKHLSLQHVACSGAEADDGLYHAQTVGSVQLAPQLDQAFATGVPQTMTITIGANDVHWAEFVKQCYAIKCGTAFDNIRAQAYLLDLRWELYRTFSTIEAKSNGTPPKVYITGYFDPAAGQTCAALPNVTAQESAWLSKQVAYLNNAINGMSSWYSSFVTYVPVDFSGHGLCSATPWVQGLADPAPVHPTAAGQTAMARAVVKAMQ